MGLDDTDLRSLLEVSAALATDPAPSFDMVLTLIRGLIPCDSVSFNDMTLATGDYRYMIVPANKIELAERLKPEYDRYAHQHPLITKSLQSYTMGAIRFCDVPDLPIVNTDLYSRFYEPFGIRYQLVIRLPSPPDVIVGYALNRKAGNGEFSDRDVAMLNGLAGYLAMHHRLVIHAERSRAIAVEADRSGWAVMTVRSDGVIEVSSPTSLSPMFNSGQRLPAVVDDLIPAQVDQKSETTSHDVKIDGERWRCVVHPNHMGPTVLLMRRLGDESAHAAQLRDVGLTPRQTDVAIELTRTGGTNAQIGHSLKMSAGTVKKHLEVIFRVLGVDSRSAAAVALRSMLFQDTLAEAFE